MSSLSTIIRPSPDTTITSSSLSASQDRQTCGEGGNIIFQQFAAQSGAILILSYLFFKDTNRTPDSIRTVVKFLNSWESGNFIVIED